MVSGLQAHPELNGLVGTLGSFDAVRSRWRVKFPSQACQKLLRPGNLSQSQLPLARARLGTAYAEAPLAMRIADVYNDVSAGNGCCFLLGHFAVVSVSAACGRLSGDDIRAEHLLRCHCQACGQSFAWDVLGGDDGGRAAKRRRAALPCGHWVFGHRYHFSLELRDLQNSSNSLMVSVCDDRGVFLGECPEVSASDAAARQRATELLRALVQSQDPGRRVQPPEQVSDRGHILTVTRCNGAAIPGGAYLVHDTWLQWIAPTAHGGTSEIASAET